MKVDEKLNNKASYITKKCKRLNLSLTRRDKDIIYHEFKCASFFEETGG
jgi:hypothetical protein